MVTYSNIDEVLLPWAEAHRLTVFTVMRDDPIRLLAVNDPHCDLSVDPDARDGFVRVRAAKGGNRLDESVSLNDLRSALDRALDFLSGT